MGTVIAIRRSFGESVETKFYGKPDDVKLEAIIDPVILWSSAPKVYLTGISAIPTQKRIVALLAKIDPTATYKLERLAAEDVLGITGLTARPNKQQGRIMPKYGNGG